MHTSTPQGKHFDLIRTQVTTVWPAPDGLWHVGVNAFEPHATTKPVTEEELGWLLQEWGVEVDREAGGCEA